MSSLVTARAFDWAINYQLDGSLNLTLLGLLGGGKIDALQFWQTCAGRPWVPILYFSNSQYSNSEGALPPQRKVLIPRGCIASSSCIMVCIVCSAMKPLKCLRLIYCFNEMVFRFSESSTQAKCHLTPVNILYNHRKQDKSHLPYKPPVL